LPGKIRARGDHHRQRPGPKRDREPPLSRAALFLLKLLLFKLMVMSGVVKLTSGDDSWGWLDHSFHWSALTALDYHYWSQPLPTIFAWWADKSPEWFKHFSVAFCLVVEIIVPLLMWAPRRLRLIAAGLFIFLQAVIALTGNYCFFNLLTIALCLLLIDDATFGWPRVVAAAAGRGLAWRLAMLFPVAVIIVVLPLNGWLIFTAFKPEAKWPRPLAFVYERVEPFRIANGYGLFRVMTKDRREIEIEGSADGIDWLPYEFKWKPGDVKRAPGWCAPHQPRLDWQMWFAALGSPREKLWFYNLEICLLEGKTDVTRLFARNPADAVSHASAVRCVCISSCTAIGARSHTRTSVGASSRYPRRRSAASRPAGAAELSWKRAAAPRAA